MYVSWSTCLTINCCTMLKAERSSNEKIDSMIIVRLALRLTRLEDWRIGSVRTLWIWILLHVDSCCSFYCGCSLRWLLLPAVGLHGRVYCGRRLRYHGRRLEDLPVGALPRLQRQLPVRKRNSVHWIPSGPFYGWLSAWNQAKALPVSRKLKRKRRNASSSKRKRNSKRSKRSNASWSIFGDIDLIQWLDWLESWLVLKTNIWI